MFSLLLGIYAEEPPNCFPQRLHYFTSRQPCTRVPVSPRPRRHLSLPVSDDGLVVLIYISLISDVRHLFMCLLAFWVFSLERTLCPLLIGLSVLIPTFWLSPQSGA